MCKQVNKIVEGSATQSKVLSYCEHDELDLEILITLR
jgi:hypothetical protein